MKTESGAQVLACTESVGVIAELSKDREDCRGDLMYIFIL